MRFRSGVAVCSRPCRPTPHLKALPAAAPPDAARSLLTPPLPLPLPLPPPLLPPSPLHPPPAHLKMGHAPHAPHTGDEQNELLIYGSSLVVLMKPVAINLVYDMSNVTCLMFYLLLVYYYVHNAERKIKSFALMLFVICFSLLVFKEIVYIRT